MKIRKRLGSDAVQGLIAESLAHAQQFPARIDHEPWPPSERVLRGPLKPDDAESRDVDE